MSMEWKQSVILIKDKQTIISHLVTLKFKISKQQNSDIHKKQREDHEIHRQCRDKRRTENTGFKGFSSKPLAL